MKVWQGVLIKMCYFKTATNNIRKTVDKSENNKKNKIIKTQSKYVDYPINLWHHKLNMNIQKIMLLG